MLDAEGRSTLIGLRLLIACAAQKDSLNWWEDDSLSPAGSYLLERLFLADPTEAGRKLALEAARTRYQAAFNGDDTMLHLFRLDKTGDVEYGLQDVRVADIPIPSEPIATLDALQEKLIELIGSIPQIQIVGERANHRLEIAFKNPTTKPATLDIAKALSWASLEGKPGQPIFPYITSL